MGAAMPQFTPELIRDMRKALEDAMTRVPVEYTTAAVKVYLAECILRAAAQGHTSYNELFSAAADQIRRTQRQRAYGNSCQGRFQAGAP